MQTLKRGLQQQSIAEPLPREWWVEVDNFGAFQAPSVLENTSSGNYRLSFGDTLKIFVPAGTLVNQSNVELHVKDGKGECHVLTGLEDALGHLTFNWDPKIGSAGSCALTFSYCPFSDTEGETNTSHTQHHDASTHCELQKISLLPPYCSHDHHKRYCGVTNYVIVEPHLEIQGKRIPLNALSVQTVLSRCLGRIDQWVQNLSTVSKTLEYNVVHFTPVQRLGESGSCYSIANHLCVSEELLPKEFILLQEPPDPSSAKIETIGNEAAWEILKDTLSELRTSCGLLSVTDVVLNHTANNTAWLPYHPECGYNELNSPHLKAAIELDIELQNFSEKVAMHRYEEKGLSPDISDPEALDTLISLLDDEVLAPFRLNEYFEIPRETVLLQCQQSAATITPFQSDASYLTEFHENPKDTLFKECLKHVGTQRCIGVVPDIELLRQISRGPIDAQRLLMEVQELLYKKADETRARILSAVRGYVRWERLECCRGPIQNNPANSIVPRYFTPVLSRKTHEVLHLANNGWVMGWDARADFTEPGSLVYLSRSLIVWADCVKLRYGRSRDDCPFLWDTMSSYCRRTASLFDGLRLDNCHSTPLHVAKFCLEEARSVNSNLWVFAELFTGDADLDLKYERELGLNGLVREALQCSTCHDTLLRLKEFGGDRIGTLEPIAALDRWRDPPRYRLHPKPSVPILYDCTHDNKTPHQKRTAVDALPNAAIVSFAHCPIGSTRGYDELVPYALSVVDERRLYHSYNADQPTKPASDEPCPVPSHSDLESQYYTIRTILHPESKSLALMGSWDNWTTKYRMNRCHGVWAAHIPATHLVREKPLPNKPLTFQFKFLTHDGTWFCDPSLLQVTDSTGHINNVATVDAARCFSVSGKPNASTNTPLVAEQWIPGSPLPGIMELRRELNAIHYRLGREGYTEMRAALIHENLIIIERHQPSTHRRCILFAFTALSPAVLAHTKALPIHYDIIGKVESVLLEARLHIPEDTVYDPEPERINGLPSSVEWSKSDDAVSRLGIFRTAYDPKNNRTHITLTAFSPGNILVLGVMGYPEIRESVQHMLSALPAVLPQSSSREDALQAFTYTLYSCEPEERDRTQGARGCYDVPGLGPLPYAGLAGVVPYLNSSRFCDRSQHTNSPFLENIQQGDWIFNYLCDRLDQDPDDQTHQKNVCIILQELASWLRKVSRLH